MGKEHELQERAVNFKEMQDLERAIQAGAFVDLTVANASKSGDLPKAEWTLQDIPAMSEQLVMGYLRKRGSHTKCFRTGACLA